MAGNKAGAQFTEQDVRNGLSVTSTGDVNVSQSASGTQGVWIDGSLVTEDGIYPTSTGQVVVNDGRIVSTGDVNVSQSASGNQTVVASLPNRLYDGVPADRCEPGRVIADPHGVLYFQKDDCCYYQVPCCAKPKKGCEGDYCGS